MSDELGTFQEGSAGAADNRPNAVQDVDVRAYFLRKRTMAVRSAYLIFPLAICAAIWAPMLGLDLALGGMCGVVNMLLVMRNNERLLVGRCSRNAYGASNTLRMLIVGLVPVFAAANHEWWYMLIAMAGFFTPLIVYSFELRSEMSTE